MSHVNKPICNRLGNGLDSRQRALSVRIITDSYLRTQKTYKYKHDVLSRDNEFFGKVDWIFSEHLLRAGHHYNVKVNNDTKNPRILEVLSELDRN